LLILKMARGKSTFCWLRLPRSEDPDREVGQGLLNLALVSPNLGAQSAPHPRGKMVWEAHAPSSGVVLYVCAVPSMKKGETVANIVRGRRQGAIEGGYRFGDAGHFILGQKSAWRRSLLISPKPVSG